MVGTIFFSCASSVGDHRTCSPNNLAQDGPADLSGSINGLTGACYHDLLAWHHEFYECNNKHSGRCKVKEALEHFPVSLEMKVFAYYGYSEFWCWDMSQTLQASSPPKHFAYYYILISSENQALWFSELSSVTSIVLPPSVIR